MRIPDYFLKDLVGKVNYIYWDNFAQIRFTWNDKQEMAILEKANFLSNGQPIPDDDEFFNHLQPGMEVVFSCKRIEPESDSPYSWTAYTCRLLRPLPFTRSVRITGLPARVSSLNGQEGTISFRNERNEEVEAYFVSSVVQVEGKAYDPSEALSTVLTVDDKVFLDAIPCIHSENPVKADNVAVKVVKGGNSRTLALRPLPSLLTSFSRSFIIREMHLLFYGRFTTFVRGRGRVVKSLNTHLGLIQGETSLGNVQVIAFHQWSSAFYESCLPGSVKETNFQPGDSVTFVAAKTSFASVLEWVALQVAPYDAETYGTLPPYENLEINRVTEEFLHFVSQ